MNYQRTRVSSVEYWDFFNEQFDMELANSKGYADYDIVYKRTKESVDKQIVIAS
tara:strand:+ start:927 stop:1088 length:162 start_codon:yes stop_codon:yes gene_type:complete